MSEPNIAGRTTEAISVVCPVCGARETFRPIVDAVEVWSAVKRTEPALRVLLQPGNLVAHECAQAVVTPTQALPNDTEERA